ncbi:hypothetical protein BJ165DRAFT_1486049 [Panaeolus papilionaceus]|nr:hypothetical protein BJ165DRAFT_1486049 [Panaeolus papilionaceus]
MADLNNPNELHRPNGPLPRVLLCFIDIKGTTQVAHYALVPLPPTYEVSRDQKNHPSITGLHQHLQEGINLAFDAFQSQLSSSKLFRQQNVEFTLMVKSIVRSGDPTMSGMSASTSIWADVHPRNQWAAIVRDGDEILVSAKMPPAPPTGAISPQDHRLQQVPSSYPGPKVVFCHKPYGSGAYVFNTLALQYIQTFEVCRGHVAVLLIVVV